MFKIYPNLGCFHVIKGLRVGLKAKPVDSHCPGHQMNTFLSFVILSIYWNSVLGLTCSPIFLMDKRHLCLRLKSSLHSNIIIMVSFLFCLSDC